LRVDLITFPVVGISGGVSCLLDKVVQNIIPTNSSTISSGCYPNSQMTIKYWYSMLRLLPLPIFIGIYLFSYWRCKKSISASDKQLKSCIDWAYLKNLPLPEKPSFIEFYIVYVSSFFKFPFGIIVQQLPFSKKVRYYEREMKLIFDKWNLEKIKKNN